MRNLKSCASEMHYVSGSWEILELGYERCTEICIVSNERKQAIGNHDG